MMDSSSHTSKKDPLKTDLPECEDRPPAMRRPRPFLRIIICILILLIAGLAAWQIIRTKPRAKRKPPPPLSAVVRVQEVHSNTEQAVIRGMGEVIPARRIAFSARVSGEVISRHPDFEAGGRLPAGTEVVKIDPADYEFALAQREADLVSARAALQSEDGRRAVAEREWQVMKMNRNATAREKDLALRKPQRRQALAAVKAAEAKVKQARLDLERTSVILPFNALVLKTTVDIGSRAAAQSSLAEIAGTDEYFVQAALPSDRLDWLSVGASALVCPVDAANAASGRSIKSSDGSSGTTSGDSSENFPGNPANEESKTKTSACRTGAVKRIQGDLSGSGRMARVLVSVTDPLGLESENGKRPLLINDFVRVTIQGRELPGTIRIPRAALRQGDRVWIADADDKLAIRSVHVVWRTLNSVIVDRGLQDGDRLITSDIGSPVEGLPLTIEGQAPASDSNSKSGSEPGSTSDDGGAVQGDPS